MTDQQREAASERRGRMKERAATIRWLKRWASLFHKDSMVVKTTNTIIDGLRCRR